MAEEKKPQAPKGGDPKAAHPRGEAKPKGKPEGAAKGAAKEPAAEGKPWVEEKGPPPRLFARYRDEVVPALVKRFGYGGPLAAPRIEKIVINMGVGKAVENERRVQAAAADLAQITGQRPLVTHAKKSVSTFRLRQGMAIGCKVTLRRARMYEFMDRLISVAMPRIRDFRGLPLRSFDGRGNYTMGVSEQLIFPEIAADKMEFAQGMDITFCTTAGTDEEARALLEGFGMPFRKVEERELPSVAQGGGGSGSKAEKPAKAAKKA